MEKKLRFGCIGTGPRGCGLMEAVQMNPNAEIYAACDTDKENLAACGKKFSIPEERLFTSAEELLRSGVDAVIVATHIAKHAGTAAMALEAGVHVLSEIPTIGSLEDAKLLLKTCDTHPDTVYMAGENCCYWYFIREWKKLYEAGKLGQALFCESDYIHPWHEMERPDGKPTWRSYMPSIHYVTHNLGPLMFILDDEPAEVSGFASDINPIAERHPAPTDGVAMIKTKKGAMVKIYIGFGSTHRGGHNFIIYGSKGSLENGRLGPLGERHTYAYLPDNANPYVEEELPITLTTPGASAFGHGGAELLMIEEFINAILENRKPELDVEYGIKVSLPGLLADESAKQGGIPIKMPGMDELRK